MRKNKAQAWGFDIIVASTLFLIGIVVFYIYAINNSGQSEEIYNSLSYDGNAIADSLLSEGSPENWNLGNIVSIGLMSNDKINNTKLEIFYNLSRDNYDAARAVFNTPNNYFVNFSVPIIFNGTQIPGIGLQYSNPQNLIKVARFTIYNDKPVTMNVYMWN